MNTEIIDSPKTYRAPKARMVELSTSGLICASPSEQLDEQDYSDIF